MAHADDRNELPSERVNCLTIPVSESVRRLGVTDPLDLSLPGGAQSGQVTLRRNPKGDAE